MTPEQAIQCIAKLHKESHDKTGECRIAACIVAAEVAKREAEYLKLNDRCGEALQSNIALRQEIARLKHVPYRADRCVCVFENLDDDPVRECGYHQTMRERLAKAEGKNE